MPLSSGQWLRSQLGVPGGEVVLPDGERDVALQVDLRQAVRRIPAVALVEVARAGAVPGVEQPRGSRSLRGVVRGPGQGLAAVLDDRLGHVGMEGEQARVHPRLRVPEDEPGVVVAAQPGRGDAVVVAGADARPQRVEVGADPVLQFRAPRHLDVALPQIRPGGGVPRQQRGPARARRPLGRRDRGLLGRRGRERRVHPDELRELVRRPVARVEGDRLARREVLRRGGGRGGLRRDGGAQRGRDRPVLSRSWCGTRRRRCARPRPLRRRSG